MNNKKLITALENLGTSLATVREVLSNSDIKIKQNHIVEKLLNTSDISDWVKTTVNDLRIASYVIQDSTFVQLSDNQIHSTVRCVDLYGNTLTVTYNHNGFTVKDMYGDITRAKALWFITPDDEYYELYRICLKHIAKKIYETYDVYTSVRLELLPDDIYNQLSDEYKTYHLATVGTSMMYNGTDVKYNDKFYDLPSNIRSAVKLLTKIDSLYNRYFNDECDEGFTDAELSLSMHGISLKVQNDADLHDNIVDLLTTIIVGW